MEYTQKTFDIPPLKGISEQTIEEHLKLYAGYVKNTNNPESPRRLGFEFDGMRNHEIYFAALVGGPHDLQEGPLKEKIEQSFGSFQAWMEEFKTLAKTRGIGWVGLFKDNSTLFNIWIDEHHSGVPTGAQPLLLLDMWEHAYVADYLPSGKAQYIEDYLANINWSVIKENLVT